MRIHTQLDHADLNAAVATSGAAVSFHNLTRHASRTHANAYEIRLEGGGGRNNTGLYGAGDYDGATWDEWGAVLGAIYDADPTARCGGTAKRPVYADAEDFHYQTGDRFRGRDRENVPADHPWRTTYLPADTHPRHRWVYQGTWGDHGTAGFVCKHSSGCTATRPSYEQIQARREQIGA